MRTFVQLLLNNEKTGSTVAPVGTRTELPTTPPTHKPVGADPVYLWLQEEELRPQTINIPEDVLTLLLGTDEIPKGSRLGKGDTANDHAINIILAIPRFEFERAHALNTAKYIIHLDDTANNATVWGLVCVDGATVTIRWRHRSTRSLEYATEELIALVLANKNKLFLPFRRGHRVPVREPLSTSDAYSGEILGTESARVSRAKSEKPSEFWIYRGAVGTFLLCTLGGFLCFYYSDPDDLLRWLSGAFDRLATTALATGAVSYLGYRFRREELRHSPVIKWD